MKFLSGKKQNFQSCDCSLEVLNFQDFQIGGHWINGILANSIQSLLLTEQAGIEVTLKECIEEVPCEIFWIKDDEVFIENPATMTEILHGLSLSVQTSAEIGL